MSYPRLDVPADEERVIRFFPAFHRCTDPKGNFGIGAVKMLWILRVGDSAMTWDTFTGWGLPDEAFHAAAPGCEHPRHQESWPSSDPNGGAVDWHTPFPQYEDHELAQESCPVTGTRCYLGTGYLLGSELFDLLCVEGDDAVWRRLRSLLDETIREAMAS